MPANSIIRASDRDRDDIAARLGDHLAAGRLDLAEFYRRLDAAFAARTTGELEAVFADLPQDRAALTAAVASTPAPSGSPWASWLLTSLICVVIWTATSVASGAPSSFWPAWVIGPWGLVLLSRAAPWRRA